MEVKTKVKNLSQILRKNKIIIVIILFLLLVIYIIADQYVILTPEYTIESSKVNSDITVAVISDLHNMDFGFNNSKVIDKVKSKSPDIIAVVGDIIDEDSKNITPALSVMKALPEIAPTYYVVGNHDILCEYYYDDFKYESKKAGVNFLNDKKEDITIKGNNISLLGITSYSFGDVENKRYTELIRNFCESDSLKILLCHYPEYSTWFFENDKYYEYDFDLMFSGHTHGGLVRLPFIGGIVAPNQGFFPKYTKGLYYVDEENENPYYMMVTGGLGQDKRFFRVNNFPEVVFVNITNQG